MARGWQFLRQKSSNEKCILNKVDLMKEQLIWLYRHLTRIQRMRLHSALRRRGQVPVGILFYHRIADKHPNAWTMSCRDFSRQLDWLQTHFDIVDLAEAQRRLQSGVCEQPTVCITFDDGYAENADFALPELVRRGLPATYFVSTEFVRTGASFPHDVAEGIALVPNTIAQLREFSEQGIEVAAHTRTHANLGTLHDVADIEAEIYGSVCDLQDWLGQPVRYFAFPFGQHVNFTQAAIDAVARAGLAGFCSAYGDWNWPGDNGFHLRRIHADPGLERLKNWLTYDPRKLLPRVEFPFADAPQPQSIDDRHNFASAAGDVAPLGNAPLADVGSLPSHFTLSAN